LEDHGGSGSKVLFPFLSSFSLCFFVLPFLPFFYPCFLSYLLLFLRPSSERFWWNLVGAFEKFAGDEVLVEDNWKKLKREEKENTLELIYQTLRKERLEKGVGMDERS
jgi:hypothetical protein